VASPLESAKATSFDGFTDRHSHIGTTTFARKEGNDMKRFSDTKIRPQRANPAAPAPVRSIAARAHTFEGGLALERDSESDLFLQAATNLVGEDAFYERASDRDAPFVALVHEVTQSNPAFIAGADLGAGKVGLAQYLRETMLMRSPAVVMAAEFVAAGGAGGRSVIARTLQRADEPAELVGYWLANHGRRLPMPVKRGVADAVRRLYTESTALCYDGMTRQLHMADVIELVHPEPTDAAQSSLFRYLLDRRHHDDAVADANLKVLTAAAELDAVPVEKRRLVLRVFGAAALARAGFSWERLSSWLPDGMDADVWEAVIPAMSVMELIRNLGNFDRAGISDAAVDTVIARIVDPDAVAKARLFPYQVWAVYNNASSDLWKRALARTLELTTANVASLDGTLVVIDTSGSMQGRASGRSAMSRVEVAAVMATATAKGARDADVVVYGVDNTRVQGLAGTSVPAGVEKVVGLIGSVGHATYGHTAIARHFDPKRHRRVVLFTDDKQQDSGHVRLDHVPLIFTINLDSDRPSALPAGQRGRYTLDGFTDAIFTAMAALEAGRDSEWPF
jgi:hypothetical protein